ncbi:MAG: type III pantothenate kinase [Spirochaetota bacterium]
MLLALDARNGFVTLGFREGGTWLVRRSFGVPQGRSADEYALLFSLTESAIVSPGLKSAVDRAILSSVVPALTAPLVAAVASAFGVEVRVVGPGLRTGLRIRSDLPQELGSDIVCCAVAARAMIPSRPCVIIDFSDALVFSALNSAGDFLGAAIAPGKEASSRGLHESAALLPVVGTSAPLHAIGRNTQASIQSGLYHGFSGLVERLSTLFRIELEEPDHPAASIEILATGRGAGRDFVRTLVPSREVDDLALEGLAIIDALR